MKKIKNNNNWKVKQSIFNNRGFLKVVKRKGENLIGGKTRGKYFIEKCLRCQIKLNFL